MKGKLCLVLFLIAIVLVNHSGATDSAKSREKCSPKKLFVSLARSFMDTLGYNVAKQIPTIGDLIRTDISVGNVASKNPKISAGVEGGVISARGSNPGIMKCEVKINRDLPDLQPVFIKNGSLMLPSYGTLTWATSEMSSIACPPAASGRKNFINGTNNIAETIICHNGLFFIMNDKLVNITTITCAHKITGNYALRSDPQCMGTSKVIGFNVPEDNFYELFCSCIDEPKASVLYTYHVILCREISHRYIYRGSRPGFSPEGFPSKSVREAYLQVRQKERLVYLFQPGNNNSLADAERYFSLGGYLDKSHLTPVADQLYTPWQWSTYFFINVVGMWNKINNGNWKTLETKVRTLANNLPVFFLEIYTGTYGTLALCSSTNYCPDFTLEGEVPVPKWLWKIVKAPILDAAIALVVSNNPFMSVDPICGSSEVNYGWYQEGFDYPLNGKVSYCSVKELREVVGYIPQAALATHVLTYK